MGPEPLSPDFDVDALAAIVRSSSQQIKGLLRSQSVIAGIGNAYSDEILHAAKISPFAIAKSLVELHGGRMRIRSRLGKGTLVVVRLPLNPQCPLPKEEAA